jgi:hypothetical protein
MKIQVTWQQIPGAKNENGEGIVCGNLELIIIESLNRCIAQHFELAGIYRNCRFASSFR